MKKYSKLRSGITAANGFSASGIAAGIKKFKPDLAIVYSSCESSVAACFTQNSFKAAPVLLSMKHAENGKARAILINSGNANACTGSRGMQDAEDMAAATAKSLGILPEEVLVASTGIIGVPLPMDKILPGIEKAAASLSLHGGADAAKAIMTTDTFKKEVTLTLRIGGKKVTIGGMAKGSGMIHPNMATMLSFITTDAAIDHKLLSKALSNSVSETYNMITVDGDSSTNDMVICMASGLAGNSMISWPDRDYDAFYAGLHHVNRTLAKMIARDGEGATKFLQVEIKNAPTKADAQKAAKSVAGSSLVKSAFFGEDANWGRVFAALGYSGADLGSLDIDVDFISSAGGIQLAKGGAGLSFDEEMASRILSCSEIRILIDLHSGVHEATAWGCDLSFDYVKINASYRS